ncbi:hypothetical protein ACET3Z_025141 [Daucus carota]
MKPKKVDKSSKLILEEVIGLTTKDANGLASSSSSSKCVYIAGCVAVVYDVDSGTHSNLVVSHRMPKPLSCIAVSPNGKFVAAGESGCQSAVLVWDLESSASLFELKGHQLGVACIDFSPDGKHLVSVGFSHDGHLRLWEWRSGILAAKVKASSSFTAVASVKFTADGKFILTAGKSHLKFWKLSKSSRANARTGLLAICGNSINLGHHRGCSFVALSSSFLTKSRLVDCNQNPEISPIHALTDTGILCLLDSQFKITKSVDLKVKKGFALSASNNVVACACNNGVVKMFAILSLKYSGSLLYTEVKRCNKLIVKECDIKANESGYPDAIACQFSPSNKLVVVYEDHCLYVWDIHDESKGTKSCVLVSHSACVWDVKSLSCEHMHDPSLACAARGCPGGTSFTTCSADGTIRLWDLILQSESSEGYSSTVNDCSLAITEPDGASCLVSAGIFEREYVMSNTRTKGFRAMAVSSDGKHLAAGDCEGNLHLYNLHTSDYIYIPDAHNAEILSLTFSSPTKNDSSEKDIEVCYFLASGGRDHIIHLYDVDRNFNLIGSVEDHSAAVTSLKVNASGRKLLSCSAAGCMMLHDVAAAENGYNISRCPNQVASHENVYDMAVDAMLECIVTVGKDKKVNTFNIAAEKLIGSFKQDEDFGEARNTTLDPSSSYLVSSYANKSICMYDFLTGELVARAVGHGDTITGITFLPDCKHLVSVDANGCIFLWKLPDPFSSRIVKSVEKLNIHLSPFIKDPPVAFSQIQFLEGDDSLCKANPLNEAALQYSGFNLLRERMSCQGGNPEESTSFKFSVSRLPKWAQEKVTEGGVFPTRAKCSSLQQVGLQDVPNSVRTGKSSVARHELHTPCKDNVEYSTKTSTTTKGSEDTESGSSTTPKEASRSFALDRRWITIHTVCLDLLNSPEVWDMKQMQVQQPFRNLSGDNIGEDPTDNQHIKLLSGVGDCKIDNSYEDTIGNHANCEGTMSNDTSSLNNSGSIYNSISPHDTRNAVACCRENTCSGSEDSEHKQPASTESRGETTEYTHPSTVDDDQENKTPYPSSENLFENIKDGKSSLRRRYSSQFVVRHDLLRGQQKQLGTPIRSRGTMSSSKDTRPCILLEDHHSVQIFEESPKLTKQGINAAQVSLSPNCLIPPNDSVGLSSRHEEFNFGVNDKTDTISSCEEALIRLDSATENALEQFSKLDSLASKINVLTGPEAHLYDEATKMLPSIAKRVHTIARLAQSKQNNHCEESGIDIPSFEPLLGIFAENISQRVVEILKKNAVTL